MSKQTKALVYNMLGFLILFIAFRYLVATYAAFRGWQIPVAAFLIATILAPKFQVVKTNDGEKLFMKWLFMKGVKEIK
jgi:hypothetical protein